MLVKNEIPCSVELGSGAIRTVDLKLVGSVQFFTVTTTVSSVVVLLLITIIQNFRLLYAGNCTTSAVAHYSFPALLDAQTPAGTGGGAARCCYNQISIV